MNRLIIASVVTIAILLKRISAANELFVRVKDEEIEDLEKVKKAKLFSSWSAWSHWSECSRSCDGGVRHQLRRCLGNKCQGKTVRHELCSRRKCPSSSLDFRASQCKAYDSVMYRNYMYDRWLPAESDREPCALLCKSVTYGFTVKFEDKVQDGTLCKNESRDVCIQGKCVRIGCDNILESGKVVDDCGVCGGNGLSCGRPVYDWKETYRFSPCDKSCGPETWRVSISACLDAKRGVTVPEELCADKTRPRPNIEKCPYRPCPSDSNVVSFSKSPKVSDFRWLTGNWKECNVTCGGGTQWRDVYCAERHNNTQGVMENRKVSDGLCFHNKKPVDYRECNNQKCPVWEVGDWSDCTVTCGKGTQVRKVACRQERFKSMDRNACNPSHKPRTKQVCYTGVSCAQAEENSLADYERYRYVAAAPFSQWDQDGMSGSPSIGAQPKWIPEQWKDCSTSCGPGVRTREVSCMAVQMITGATLNLPDYECEGTSKPAEFEPCELRKCPHSGDVTGIQALPLLGKEPTELEYHWDFGAFSECSASCLGGKQRSSLKCVEAYSGKSVAWSFCNPAQRPAEIIKTCNNKPCPPKWDIGRWSVCSQSCGGGLTTRKVRCIRVISSRGGPSDTLILPDNQCGNSKPRDSEPCGLQDCPAHWNVGDWSPCSVSCGSGDQRRLVICEQIMANGKLQRYNIPNACNHLENPTVYQLCNLGICPTPLPALKSTLKNFEQLNNHRRLTLRIGGVATLFQGTSVKIKCPVRNFDRSKIHWTKNGRLLEQTDRLKISKFGALRIFNAEQTDAGLYACIAGNLRGNITLHFKPHKTAHDKGNMPKNRPGIPKTIASSSPVDKSNRVDGQKPDLVGKNLLQFPQLKGTNDSGLDRLTSLESGEEEDDLEELKPLESESPTLRPSGPPVEQQPTPAFFKDRQSNDKGVKNSGKSVITMLREALMAKGEMRAVEALRDENDLGVVKAEWKSGPWSSCSHTCSDSNGGMMIRDSLCQVDVHGVTSYVNASICEAMGLETPIGARICGTSPCPRWKPGEWSDCKQSRCARFSTAIQRRDISCMFPNSTVVADMYCNKKTRPSLKRECFNDECAAEWRASNWGQCSRTCGAGGVEMRTVTCVWHGKTRTRKPAGNSCRGSDRPKIIRPCRTQPPCPSHTQPELKGPFKDRFRDCTDVSRYCSAVKLFQLCNDKDYSQKCCLTCTYLRYTKKSER